MAAAYHMVHYRRFVMHSPSIGGATLEELCRAALSVSDHTGSTLWGRPHDRLFDSGEGGRQLLLNKVADLSSAVFGELCLAQSGELQALLSLQPTQVQLSDLTTAVIFDLDEREAPAGSQFIRGMAYWLVIGNHVFFVKTHSMTPDLMRDYWDWLLKLRTKTLGKEIVTSLQAEFDRTTAAGDIGEIRNLQVIGKSAPQLVTKVPETNTKEVKTSRKIADRFVEFSQAAAVVEALFGKQRATSLVDSLGPGEYLAVDAQVKVRGQRTEESRAELRSIATDLADQSDAEVRIQGKDGQVSNGDAILRTRMPFYRPSPGSNLLDFDNVADQLQEVYTRFVADGKIEA